MDELRNQFLSLSSIRSMNAIFSTIANDEMYQINGLMMLTDISGINLKDLNLQNDPAIQKYYQEINVIFYSKRRKKISTILSIIYLK